MITGRVKPSREAVVRLQLRGASGAEVEVEAVLDIGMSLLYDHLLTMQVTDGGPVTIDPLS
jgi:hypothetical protein